MIWSTLLLLSAFAVTAADAQIQNKRMGAIDTTRPGYAGPSLPNYYFPLNFPYSRGSFRRRPVYIRDHVQPTPHIIVHHHHHHESSSESDEKGSQPTKPQRVQHDSSSSESSEHYQYHPAQPEDLKYDEVPYVSKQLIDDLVKRVFSHDKYISLLSRPGKEEVERVIEDVLQQPIQMILHRQLLYKLLSVVKFYEQRVKVLTNTNEKAKVVKFIEDLIKSEKNGTLTPELTVKLKQRFEQLAILQDDSEIHALTLDLIESLKGVSPTKSQPPKVQAVNATNPPAPKATKAPPAPAATKPPVPQATKAPVPKATKAPATKAPPKPLVTPASLPKKAVIPRKPSVSRKSAEEPALKIEKIATTAEPVVTKKPEAIVPWGPEEKPQIKQKAFNEEDGVVVDVKPTESSATLAPNGLTVTSATI